MGGYKTYADYPASNCTLPATDLNEYNMKQVIARFATNAARNTAIQTPENGQMCYSAEYDELYEWNVDTTSWIGAVPRVVVKDSETYVYNSTTYIDDPHLQILLEGGSTYAVTHHLMYSSHATADIKFHCSYSGTLTDAYWGFVWNTVNSTSANNTTDLQLDALNFESGFFAGGVGASDVIPVFGHGRIITDTTGTLKLRFAQSTAYAANTTLRAGSFLSFLKVA